MPRARPSLQGGSGFVCASWDGGELPPSCAAAAASPPRAGEWGDFHPVKEAPGAAGAKRVCSAKSPDAGPTGTEPRHYDDFGDGGLGRARVAGTPARQSSCRPRSGPGGAFWLGGPLPCSPSPLCAQPAWIQAGTGGWHLWQSPGNARAEGELERKRQLQAWSLALSGPRWAAGVSRAGAWPHRLAGSGLAPST